MFYDDEYPDEAYDRDRHDAEIAEQQELQAAYEREMAEQQAEEYDREMEQREMEAAYERDRMENDRDWGQTAYEGYVTWRAKQLSGIDVGDQVQRPNSPDVGTVKQIDPLEGLVWVEWSSNSSQLHGWTSAEGLSKHTPPRLVDDTRGGVEVPNESVLATDPNKEVR